MRKRAEKKKQYFTIFASNKNNLDLYYSFGYQLPNSFSMPLITINSLTQFFNPKFYTIKNYSQYNGEKVAKKLNKSYLFRSLNLHLQKCFPGIFRCIIFMGIACVNKLQNVPGLYLKVTKYVLQRKRVYHTKKMSYKNIPIFFVQRWKQMLNASVVYLKQKYHQNLHDGKRRLKSNAHKNIKQPTV